MLFLHLVWISPSGEFVQVRDHRSYAHAVTGVARNDPDDDLSYKTMFENGWIRGSVEKIENVSALILNNDLETHMTTLENLPPEQRKSILDYAHKHGLEILNCQLKRITRAGEDVMKEQTSTTLTTPEFKQRLASLYAYLVKHLGISKSPKLKLVNSRQNADNPFGLTGHYDHTNYLITVYITDRHDTDILRSFAHEVIHHWQNLRGVLHPEETIARTAATEETNKNEEGQHYAQINPHLRKKEMEAYLFGNILFRDWQDEMRMGPPTVQPFMPQTIDESIKK